MGGGILLKHQRKWQNRLDAFGSLPFATSPLYSNFIKQKGYVSCHPACFLMLTCAMSRRAVSCNMWLLHYRL